MSDTNEQKQIGQNISNADSDTKPQHYAPTQGLAEQTTAPPVTRYYKHQAGSIPETNPDSFIQKGKVFAHTVNAPFTTIPFVPAATTFLKKFDNATNQDLGITYKASTSSQGNAQGRQDLIYRIDYIGFGVMSRKFNVQIAPIAAKIEVGKEIYKGFGCNASVLSNPLGAVHERLGIKATFTDCNGNSKSVSVAAEASYQKSDSFRPLSTATYGYFFGNDATVRIPAAYVPTLERIKAASPSIEELKVMAEHIAPSIPAIQIGKFIDYNIKIASAIVKSAITATKPDTRSASTKNTETIKTSIASTDNTHSSDHAATKTNQENHTTEKHHATQKIKPSIEEKANYTVQPNDTLAIIGRKTGHTWLEILALNKNTLKNNPDLIYPGQELRIPDNHAALLNHPIVQARIRENLAILQRQEYTR